MPTNLSVIQKPLPYGYQPTTVTWTNGDTTGNTYLCTGRETLHVKGTGTVLITTAGDVYGRGGAAGTGNIGPITLGGNEFIFQTFPQSGFAVGGYIQITPSASTVQLWVEQDP